MTKMKAIGFTKSLPITDKNSLAEFEIEKPTPTDNDILVKVAAISVNPVDVLQRSETGYDNREPKILGFDAVGIVTELGENAHKFSVGDRIYYSGDLNRQGSDAEYELIDERIVALAPTKLDDAHAASVPLTGLTAWEAMFEILGINPTDREQNQKKNILLINGAGGAGSMAVQLAHWAGLNVIASASRPETIDWVRKLGADEVVNHRNNLVDEVRNLGHQYVDYIFDMHSVDRHWGEMTELIAPAGKMVSITRDNKPINLSPIKRKRASFGWELVFSKVMFQTDDVPSQGEILSQLASLLDNGTLQSTTVKTLTPINVENMKQAHTEVESGRMVGKIALSNEE